MPLLNYTKDSFPKWSDIFNVEHIHLGEGTIYKRCIESMAAFFVISGRMIYCARGSEGELSSANFTFLDSPDINFKSAEPGTEIFIIYGDWGTEIGNCGLFTLTNSATPKNTGDEVSYSRSTDFDNHFHDCDEYWFILKGSGTAVSGGNHYNIKAGDCLATPAGEHHDIPHVSEPISGIYFETTLKGAKRIGHLWDYINSNHSGS